MEDKVTFKNGSEITILPHGKITRGKERNFMNIDLMLSGVQIRCYKMSKNWGFWDRLGNKIQDLRTYIKNR